MRQIPRWNNADVPTVVSRYKFQNIKERGENMQEVLTIINTVGFPVAMCIFLCWYIKDATEKNREEIKKINEEHREEVKEITRALENNTLALTKLCEKMGD